MKSIVQIAKFIIRFFLFNILKIFPQIFFSVNRENWEKRILLVNLEKLGDLVLFTSVLKYIKSSFVDKKIYLVISESARGLLDDSFDNIIYIREKDFIKDTRYSICFMKLIRKIGFETTINFGTNQTHTTNYLPLFLCSGSKRIIGSSGESFLYGGADRYEKFVNFIYNRFSRMVFTDIINHKTFVNNNQIRPVFLYQREILDSIVNVKGSDYATLLCYTDIKNPVFDAVGHFVKNYVVVGVGAGDWYRVWPLERVSSLISFLIQKHHVFVVLVGSADQYLVSRKLMEVDDGHNILNFVGKTDVFELKKIIQDSLLVFSNETLFVHIAIALKKPSICVVGGGHFGRCSVYGYRSINKWLYTKTDCFLDNWMCGRRTVNQTASPCIDAVSIGVVESSVDDLINYLKRDLPMVDRFEVMLLGGSY